MSTKPVITFDFDSTLCDSDPIQTGWGWASSGTCKPIARVCNLVYQKAKDGHEIHIVTFRHKDSSKDEIEDFVERWKLPVKSVVYTGGATKVPFLKKLRSILHVDDDVETCLLASLAGIDVLLVDDGQHEKNSTAKLFKKI